MVPDVMMGSLPLLKISTTNKAARLTLTRSRMLGAYEYPLQAADVHDYFLQSGPTRP